MSWRTWIGEGRRDWADENLCDYPDLVTLAQEIAWHMPAKLAGDDPRKIMELLEILAQEHSMPPDEFWAIWYTLPDGTRTEPRWIEHPTWDELEAYLGVKRNVLQTP